MITMINMEKEVNSGFLYYRYQDNLDTMLPNLLLQHDMTSDQPLIYAQMIRDPIYQ